MTKESIATPPPTTPPTIVPVFEDEVPDEIVVCVARAIGTAEPVDSGALRSDQLNKS